MSFAIFISQIRKSKRREISNPLTSGTTSTNQSLGHITRLPKKSYKKECQEKNLPSRPDAGPFSSRHSAQLFERALSTTRVVFLRPSALFRLRVRNAGTLPLPCGSISLLRRRHSSSETSSLTVIHCMSGNAWSYWRLAAYGFLGLSERA